MTKYALGFICSKDQVILIHKNRPDWQAGKLNGLGGKIESGESGLDTIVREVQEEAGVITNPRDWRLICLMQGPDWQVDVFSMHLDTLPLVESLTDEIVEVFDIANLPPFTLGSVRWLLAMSSDSRVQDVTLTVTYPW